MLQGIADFFKNTMKYIEIGTALLKTLIGNKTPRRRQSGLPYIILSGGYSMPYWFNQYNVAPGTFMFSRRR